MSKDSLFEKIKEDFAPITFSKEETQPVTKARTKPYPGARIIPLGDIMADSDQPRKNFDEQKITELADSIRGSGIIQPIIVRPAVDNGKFFIVAGERRYRAAKLAGLTEIPCILKEIKEQEALTIQLIENLQKESLTPIEEAQSFKRLLATGLTQMEISKKIGKSQSSVSQVLKILDLPPKILEEAEQMKTPKEHLLQISRCADPERLWQEVKEGKTANEIKAKVQKEKISKGRPKNFSHTIKPKGKPFKIIIQFNKPTAELHEIKEALQEALTIL